MQSKTYTAKNSKILVETSVLVAASVRFAFPLEGELKDEFYDAAINLFALIRDNLSDRLGIITQTIESEAYNTLAFAVGETLRRGVADKQKQYEYNSIALNKCTENMRKLDNALLREPCDEETLPDLTNEVYHMYKGLEEMALETEEAIIDRAHRGIEGATTAKMRTALFDIHIQIVRQENVQLLRLKRHHASPTDKKILAEAIQIKRRYADAGVNLHFFIASTDSNNFSPATSEWGPSRVVTEEIRGRYGIVCDWPTEILKLF